MVVFRVQHALCLVLLAALLGARSVAAEEGPAAESVRRLIRELDDDAFQTRRQAEIHLIDLGRQALPEVKAATRHPSAEVRHRARRIVLVIEHRLLSAGFQKLLADGEAVDLEEGMLLIAEIVDPQVDRRAIRRQLDELADKVRAKLGREVDPGTAPAEKLVEAIRQVVFVEAGFNGAVTDYDNPANSSLAHVLATKRGLPILLSHVVVSVGKRLHAPLVGVAVPRRYMVKYDGAQAPPGAPKNDIIIDPFGGGRTVNVDEIEDLVGGFDPLRNLAPSEPRATLARMLRNLGSDFRQNGLPLKVWQADYYLKMVDK